MSRPIDFCKFRRTVGIVKTIIGHEVCIFVPDDQAFLLIVDQRETGEHEGISGSPFASKNFFVLASAADTEVVGGPYQESMARVVMRLAAHDLVVCGVADIVQIERRISDEAAAMVGEADDGAL